MFWSCTAISGAEEERGASRFPRCAGGEAEANSESAAEGKSDAEGNAATEGIDAAFDVFFIMHSPAWAGARQRLTKFHGCLSACCTSIATPQACKAEFIPVWFQGAYKCDLNCIAGGGRPAETAREPRENPPA